MTTEEKIWQGLKAAGCNDYGAAGMMGNLYAESALRSNNLQNAYEKKLGMGDDAYTAAVDNGTYTGFVNDSAGYGLAQWTYHTRKAALLDFAKKMGKSIGDLDMQIAFLVKELGSYAGTFSVLKSAKSVREASDKVLTDFERPADQSEAVKVKRAGYGQTYFDKYAAKASTSAAVGGNSGLVDCTIYSPNHSGKRTHTLDTLTPHCVVGQCSAERVGEIFKPTSRQASSNYAIGYDGRVCLIVDECNRSWCTSSNANDQRAITIECASDTTEPYAMNSKVYEKLILLCADICRRNGKTKVLWLGSKEKTLAYTPKADEMVLTAHRWFANKSCPGEWLYSRYGELASRITALLSGNTTVVKPAESIEQKKDEEKITKMASAPNFDSSARHGRCFKVNATSGLNVRYGPDANKYAVITALENGKEVIWYGYYAVTGGAKWLYVAFGNKTGWVHSAYLK